MNGVGLGVVGVHRSSTGGLYDLWKVHRGLRRFSGTQVL